MPDADSSTPRTTTRVRGYLPTLDGWRALAVISVILFHDRLYSYGPLNTHWFQEHGSFGVDIFFGISGLLICSRLLEEERKYGRIRISQFYIRRAFRILPPLLCYLFVIALLALAGVIAVDAKEWIASLLFCRNYSFLGAVAGHDNWYTGHFWSLAVEEHFYFLLPAMLVFVPKRWRVPSLAGIAIAVEVWRALRQQTRPWIYLFQHTDVRLDALLVPALCAILMTEPCGAAISRKSSDSGRSRRYSRSISSA
ncbi:MAG TPA: acyltransferase [Bryobacteraceae bacterium]|nr:acyltransferase [Bryobacteraceae bacterium]